jgi:hypothetical protein
VKVSIDLLELEGGTSTITTLLRCTIIDVLHNNNRGREREREE